ncbi:MAG: hypothetical protein ABEJ68_11090 [Halobacteriaceae archaeon]
MQRRAAAVSAVVLLLITAGSYAYIGMAEEPEITVEGDHTLSQSETLEVGGTTYTVSSLSDGRATFAWTVEAATYTQQWANNTTVEYGNESYLVVIPNESDPQQFTLREDLNVTAILEQDSDVENETVTIEGERQVVYSENNSYVPLSEYLPEPSTVDFEEGQTWDFRGNQTTVSNLTRERAVLTWTAPRDKSVSAAEGANVTLGDTTYLAHFPSGSEVVLSTNFHEYQESVDRNQYFTERVNGLWGVSILSGLTAILLLGMAYLPSRY